jgi:hypothetical protein
MVTCIGSVKEVKEDSVFIIEVEVYMGEKRSFDACINVPPARRFKAAVGDVIFFTGAVLGFEHETVEVSVTDIAYGNVKRSPKKTSKIIGSGTIDLNKMLAKRTHVEEQEVKGKLLHEKFVSNLKKSDGQLSKKHKNKE